MTTRLSQPHPALFDLATGRPLPPISSVDEFLRSADEHRMSGLLWTAWSDLPDPGTWWRELALGDLRRRGAQAKMWATLTGIAQSMDDLGVELATAKGVTSEARWYRRPGERPCRDIDLLVGPDDMARAAEIVAALDPTNSYLPWVDELAATGALQSVDLVVNGIGVDLHFDILKLGFGCRQRQLIWERTQPFALGNGLSIRVLDPEVALIHFLLHLNKDRFRYLLAFVDVARILEQEQLDWCFIDRFADTEGLHAPVRLALETVLGTLGLPSRYHHPPHGWRVAAWRIAWRPSVRLQGDLGLVKFRHRQELIGMLAPGRTRDALRSLAQRLLVPPRVCVDAWYPDIAGPYLWRLARGRGHNNWRRAKAALWEARSRLAARHRPGRQHSAPDSGNWSGSGGRPAASQATAGDG